MLQTGGCASTHRELRSTGAPCGAEHGAAAALVSVKAGAGCPGCPPRVSALLPPSCSENGGGGSPSHFSFTGGRFLLGSKRAALTQRQTGWEHQQAPQRVEGGLSCALRPLGFPHAEAGPRGPHPHQGRPQGFPPHQGRPQGFPHTGAFPIWCRRLQLPGQVLSCFPAEKTLCLQVTQGTRGHSWGGFSWPALKPSGFNLLPWDTPQEPPLPFNPPCTFCLPVQASLTRAAGRLGKTPNQRR